jgi:ABC-type Fe3+-hydroxamate transport system substrate-binding protein
VKRAQRIVSLVPSLTEALFALGLGDRVVGVTDWCVHPKEALAALPRVGGTKDPDVDRIDALGPDLVVANREEQTERVVRQLEGRGLEVWVTYPRGVREAARLLEEIADLGADPATRRAVLEPIARAIDRADARRAQDPRRVRFFCPIWRDPWMSIGADTYADDLLSLCGGANVFAQLGGRRYPRVALPEVVEAAPEVILLPDEPYSFGPRDVEQLARLDLPAARDGRIHLIDGTWVSWYGPRIGTALEEITRLFSA